MTLSKKKGKERKMLLSRRQAAAQIYIGIGRLNKPRTSVGKEQTTLYIMPSIY